MWHGACTATVAGMAVAGIILFVPALLLLDYLFFLVLPKLTGKKKLSLAVEGTADEKNGHGPIHRNVASPDKLVECPDKGINTLVDTWKMGHKVSAKKPCLGHRDTKDGKPTDFLWQTYEEIGEAALNFGAGLMKLDLVPKTDKMRMLAMYMKNCPEWIVAELGLFMYNGTTVPLYDTLGEETLSYVIKQTGLKTVVCKPSEVPKLLEVMGEQAPSLKAVVVVGEVEADLKSKCKGKGLQLHSFQDVVKAGKDSPKPEEHPKPEDPATFCYTSGTTGDPKGALLSHRNMVSTLAAVDRAIDLVSGDTHLSYLPLAHVFERATIHAMLYKGNRIGFSRGDTRLIPEDIKQLRPTLFPSVPRLLNRMFDKVNQGASASIVSKTLLNMAVAHKALRMRKAGLRGHWFWDRLVCNKVAKKMGLDRCRVILSGSAPLAPHVLYFLRCVLSAVVVEGYGQTETCAGATVQGVDDFGSNVGPPLVHNEIKLVSGEESEYKVTDKWHGEGTRRVRCEGRGEIWIRGNNVFLGYYKMEDKTKEALTDDGWTKTGDVGVWLPNGALKVVDRLKNIFKLAQGEYIAAEKVEAAYSKSDLVQQVFVYGDSMQSCLVAVVVPDPDGVKSWAHSNGQKLDHKDYKAMSESKELKEAMLQDINAKAKAAKLHGFEMAKDIYVAPEPFSEDNGLMTPTFKVKRPQAKKHFQEQLDAMYEKLGTGKFKQG